MFGGDKMQLRFDFEGGDDQTTIGQLTGLLAGLTDANQRWMMDHPCPPCLFHAGVKYIDPTMCRTDDFCQIIRSAPRLLEKKEATCADMSAYFAAWLRTAHYGPASVVVEPQIDEYGSPIPHAYHAFVWSQMGRFDPSEDVKNGVCRCNFERRVVAR